MTDYTSPTTELPPSISGQSWGDSYLVGAGISAMTGDIFPESALKSCATTPAGSASYSRTVTTISSDQDYTREISVGAQGSYNMGGVKLSGKASYLNKMTYSETSMTILVQAELADEEYEMVNAPELSDKALALMKSSTEKFRDTHGDYYLAGVKKGALMTVSLVCTATSSSSLTDFKSTFSASKKDLFSASGYADFKSTASKHDVSVTFSVFMQGTTPGKTPPEVQDPDKLLEWFENNYAQMPRYAYLENYSNLYPDYTRKFPIDPRVFADIQALYEKAWLTKNRFSTAPGGYASQFQGDYDKITSTVEDSRPNLTTDTDEIAKLDAGLQDVLNDLVPIFNRFDLYQTVKGKQASEHISRDQVDSGSGNSWHYGVQKWSKPGVDIANKYQSYQKSWKSGHREHNFTLAGPSDQLIVGWSVGNLRQNSDNGYWENTTGQILLKNSGNIYVKSDLDRGCDWGVETWTVSSADYVFGDGVKSFTMVNGTDV